MTTKPKAPNPGFVYVLQSLHLYKIGRCATKYTVPSLYTKISEERRAQLMEKGIKAALNQRITNYHTHNPHGVELIGYKWVRDNVLIERLLHKKFDKYRTTREWFNLPGDEVARLLVIIESL